MKILIASSKYYPEYSGSGYRAHQTYKRLEKKFGIDFDVITNSMTYVGNKNFLHGNKKVLRISSPFLIPKKKSIKRKLLICLEFIWEIFFTWIYIKKNINKYDLLHTFGNSWSIGFLTWYFSKNNKPIIRELCNKMKNPFYPIQFDKSIKKIFLSKKTLIVAISKMLEKVVKAHGSFNLWTRLNPISDKFFIDYKNKLYLRKKLTKFEDTDIILSCVANYIPRKNQIFLIDVLKGLPPEFKLLLAGPLKRENQNYLNEIKNKIKFLNLTERVEILTGFVSNFDEFIKLSDVFLFPSIEEGLGTPIIEAQACGVPVVSNYLKDIVEDILIKGEGGTYSKLDKSEWIKNILEVHDLSKQKLINNAKKINSISSSKVIDQIYYNKILNLIN